MSAWRFSVEHPDVARRLRRLYALLGVDEGDGEAAEVATKSARVGPGNPAGRRERDIHGKVITKPNAPGGHEPEPRRDRSGRRLRDASGKVVDKPYDLDRRRRA